MSKDKDIHAQEAASVQDGCRGLRAEELEAFQGVGQASPLLNLHGAVSAPGEEGET